MQKQWLAMVVVVLVFVAVVVATGRPKVQADPLAAMDDKAYIEQTLNCKVTDAVGPGGRVKLVLQYDTTACPVFGADKCLWDAAAAHHPHPGRQHFRR